jgi:hypothetical protein
MNGKAGALAFLIVRTTRNRLARQAARLKSPRYALAVLIGLAYFWFFFFGNPALRRSREVTPVHAGAVESTIGSIAGVGFAVTAILWWLWGGVSNALAYQPAEMQMLFTAPLSRRQLLGYKIARTQVQLLFGALIWAVLMRRWGVTLTAPFRFLTAWSFFSIMSLHRFGTALVLDQPVVGRRRWGVWAGKGLAAAAGLAIGVPVLQALRRMTDLGVVEGFRGIAQALATPPASYALAPFHVLLAPLYQSSVAAWWGPFAAVAGVVVAHVLWVLAMSFVKFEESAATASAEMAKRLASIRERRSLGGVISKPSKTGRQWLPLKPTGRPAVAIVWKNTLALARTGVVRSVLIVVVMLWLGSAAARAFNSSAWKGGLAVSMAALAVMMLVLGPRAMRNDLRQDLLNLPLLKAYPLSGTTMVAAQVASPTLLLTAFQLALCVLGWWAAPAEFRPPVLSVNTMAIAVLLPVVLLTFNAIAIGIQNGAALVFPAWVRLGGQVGGVEVIGQSILVTLGSLLAQALMLILPAALGAALYFATRHVLGPATFVVAGAGGFLALGAELVAFLIVLGDVFDKLDPSALNPV